MFRWAGGGSEGSWIGGDTAVDNGVLPRWQEDCVGLSCPFGQDPTKLAKDTNTHHQEDKVGLILDTDLQILGFTKARCVCDQTQPELATLPITLPQTWHTQRLRSPVPCAKLHKSSFAVTHATRFVLRNQLGYSGVSSKPWRDLAIL